MTATEQQRELRKQELIQQTLFYKGEEDYQNSPYVTDGMSACYWDYEHVWVRWELEQDEGYLRTVHWFQTEILNDQPPYPSVPVGLQAIFASRIAHWASPGDRLTLEAVCNFCREYEQKYADAQKKI